MKKETSSRTSFVAVFATLLLAFAIFGWGTQYKLSLYKQSGKLHGSVPHAKFLSQRERASGAQEADAQRTASLTQGVSVYPAVFAAVALSILSLRLIAQFWVMFVVTDKSLRKKAVGSTFFSFRPPPAYHLFF